MPEATKVLTCKLVEGQWQITGEYTDPPLTFRDLHNLQRAMKIETKVSLRKYNLKQRALKQQALTGKKG